MILLPNISIEVRRFFSPSQGVNQWNKTIWARTQISFKHQVRRTGDPNLFFFITIERVIQELMKDMWIHILEKHTQWNSIKNFAVVLHGKIHWFYVAMLLPWFQKCRGILLTFFPLVILHKIIFYSQSIPTINFNLLNM